MSVAAQSRNGRATLGWTPPESVEVEVACIGACLRGGEQRVRQVLQRVGVEQFYRPAHQAIMRHIKALFDEGSSVDLVSVAQRLELANEIDAVGSRAYLLHCAASSPTPSNAGHYAQKVHELWVRRELLARAKALAIAAKQEADLSVVLESGLTICRGLGTQGSLSCELGDLDFASENDLAGVTTGFRTIDERTIVRGYPSGEVSVVLAKTKAGKTSWMVGSAYAASHHGRICYATFEMSAKRLGRRLLGQLTGYRRPPSDLEGAAIYQQAIDSFTFTDWTFYDPSQRDTTEDYVEDLCEFVREHHAARAFTAVYVDYVQLLGVKVRSRDEYRDLQLASRYLAKLARQLQIPVVVGSQASVVDKEVRTKGARRLEEDAGLVLELQIEPEPQVLIKLNRYGESKIAVPMRWDRQRVCFVEPT